MGDACGANYDMNIDGKIKDEDDLPAKSMDYWMQDFIDNTGPTGYPKWWTSPGKWGDIYNL